MNKRHTSTTLKDWFASACLELKSMKGVSMDIDYFGLVK